MYFDHVAVTVLWMLLPRLLFDWLHNVTTDVREMNIRVMCKLIIMSFQASPSYELSEHLVSDFITDYFSNISPYCNVI